MSDAKAIKTILEFKQPLSPPINKVNGDAKQIINTIAGTTKKNAIFEA